MTAFLSGGIKNPGSCSKCKQPFVQPFIVEKKSLKNYRNSRKIQLSEAFSARGVSGVSSTGEHRTRSIVRKEGSAPVSRKTAEDCLNLGVHALDSAEQTDFSISKSSFYHLLQRCTRSKDLTAGREVHSLIVRNGYESNTYFGSCLIRMFALCGSLSEANLTFGKLHEPNVYAWSEIIFANTKYGQSERAIKIFHQMQRFSVKPDKYVFVAVLKACASAGDLTQGRGIHSRIAESDFQYDDFIRSTLIDMYAKCASLADARSVFDKMSNQDLVIWNAMISGYAHFGYCCEALQLFEQMQQEGQNPNSWTWTAVIAGFAHYGHGKVALQLFQQMSHEGVETNNAVWNALLTGYSLHGQGCEALWLFQHMIKEGKKPDKVTFLSVVKACATIVDLTFGKLIHDNIISSGFESDAAVGTTLMDMYAKCGSLDDAQSVFSKLPKQDVIACNTLIAGCTHNAYGQDALKLFCKMRQEGMMPDSLTLLSIVKVCSLTAALNKGKLIHAHMIESGLDVDEFLGSLLIEMYAKCGNLEDACEVFTKLPKPDVVTWNAMIAGYALQSDYHLVLQCFKDMQLTGLRPDDVTYCCLLSSCSHLGLVEEGSLLFNLMREVHGILPTIEHYNCLADLLGRAGCLNQAEDLLQATPFQPSAVPWTSLLSNCRIFSDVEVGRRCFERVVTMDQRCASGYELMSKIYAAVGMIDDAAKIDAIRRHSNAWKKPGKAFIEVDKEVHGFVVGDRTHPKSNEIYAKLKELGMQLKEGCLSQLESVLNMTMDEDQVHTLWGHCERLAIAFGLISLPQGTTIRISKNLRVCTDCHIATKLISRIERRDIVITDSYRLHYFKDGACSCNDYF